ncbi:MAG: hypothetical protein HC841_05445 [Verrucomicrobiae bacterium]|nr:hypothetical protein [Verrucomicrobiae bacterium]
MAYTPEIRRFAREVCEFPGTNQLRTLRRLSGKYWNPEYEVWTDVMNGNDANSVWMEIGDELLKKETERMLDGLCRVAGISMVQAPDLRTAQLILIVADTGSILRRAQEYGVTGPWLDGQAWVMHKNPRGYGWQTVILLDQGIEVTPEQRRAALLRHFLVSFGLAGSSRCVADSLFHPEYAGDRTQLTPWDRRLLQILYACGGDAMDADDFESRIKKYWDQDLPAMPFSGYHPSYTAPERPGKATPALGVPRPPEPALFSGKFHLKSGENPMLQAEAMGHLGGTE